MKGESDDENPDRPCQDNYRYHKENKAKSEHKQNVRWSVSEDESRNKIKPEDVTRNNIKLDDWNYEIDYIDESIDNRHYQSRLYKNLKISLKNIKD